MQCDTNNGSRAKYPLATVAKILEVFGEGTCGGYDIGCSFRQTVLNSRLGPEFERLKSTLIVNAFHGYSHNYACQSINHPLSVDGTGIEDFETMERIYSSSNQLAPVIRYATAFRRRVLISLFFAQWDDDKYANIGLWLYNNIVQALDIIKEDTLALENSLAPEEIAMLDDLEQDEARYIATVGQEQPWDIHAMAYVELLEELRSVE